MPNITLPDGKKLSLQIRYWFRSCWEGKQITFEANAYYEREWWIKRSKFFNTKDSSVKIITNKDKEGLEVIRHDAAHIMAMAVQIISGTQVTIGPVIENGFYYILLKRNSQVMI